MSLTKRWIDNLQELAKNGDEVAIEALEAAGLWEDEEEQRRREEAYFSGMMDFEIDEPMTDEEIDSSKPSICAGVCESRKRRVKFAPFSFAYTPDCTPHAVNRFESSRRAVHAQYLMKIFSNYFYWVFLFTSFVG